MNNQTSTGSPYLCIAIRLIILLLLGLSIEGTNVIYAQTENKVVASVNNQPITQSEVDNFATSQLFPLQQQIYALRKAALENLVTKTILKQEAEKRNISIEELRKQLTLGQINVTPSQVEQLYLENAATFASMSPDEAKERLRLDLESQARMKNYREAIAKLKANYRVEMRLEEPKLSLADNTNPAQTKGAKDAAVTIVEFSDFQCPYCRESQSVIKQITQNYGDKVRLVFKHLPLDIHPQAFPSAQAAYCAGEQDSFWQYKDALFTSDSLTPESLNKIAVNLNLKLPKFDACVASETSRAAVVKDLQEARRLGINGTPTFIINGKLYRGALKYDDLKAAIERELKPAQTASGNQ